MSRVSAHLVLVAAPLLTFAALALDSPSRRQLSATDCPLFARPIVPPLLEPCGTACGKERWPVKTLTDRDANRVDFTPRRTTIRELGRLTPPSKRPYDRRAGVAERQLFCIEAWIVEPPRPQEDGDLHVALQQVGDTTARMLVEIPDVRCATVCSSPYAAAFAQARLTMERALKSWKGDSLRVRVVGVGFFDRNHGQFGAARNFFELHPVLAVSFP